jgi:uncharacterized protein
VPELLYADTSALVKLAVDEAETTAVREALDHCDAVATSVVTEIELGRAVLRAREQGTTALDDVALMAITASLVMIELTPAIRRTAAELQPATVRSLDAIHIATAAALGSDAAVLTYDHRMQDAATSLGLQVLAPA